MEPARRSEGIDRTVREWARAFAAGDVGALAALVTEDAEFWTQGAPPLVGRSALEAAFKAFFARFVAVQEFTELERSVAGEWAFLRGEEKNLLRPRDGGDPVEHRQRAFSVLRLGADGRWRFARGMTNQGPLVSEP